MGRSCFVQMTHLLMQIAYSLYFFFCVEIADAACSTQLIDGDGTFNVSGVDNFIKEVKLEECGLSYAVVSIMGPQSSGMYQIL